MIFIALPRSVLIRRIGEDRFLISDLRNGLFKLDFKSLVIYLNSVGEYNQLKIWERVREYVDIKFETFCDTLEWMIQKQILILRRKFDENPFRVEPIIERARRPFSGVEAISIQRLGISVTGSCPYRCRGCYRACPNENPELEVEAFFPFIEEASTYGCKYVNITGGEPTYGEAVDRALRIAKKTVELGMKCMMVTSGWDLAENINKFKKYICGVQLSLDGLKEYHNEYRGRKDAWERAIRAIKACKEAKVPVWINCVVTPNNMDMLETFYKYLIDIGVSKIRFSPLFPEGRACGSYKLDLEFYERVIKRIEELHVLMYGEAIEIEGNRLYCDAGTTQLYLMENGDIYLCPFIPKKFGNVTKHNFTQVWQNRSLDLFRNGIYPESTCLNCKYRKTCFNGCFAMYFIRKEVCPFV